MTHLADVLADVLEQTPEQRVAILLSVYDESQIRGVLRIMREEVFMSTVEDLDPVVFKLGVEQARAILFSRMTRAYIAVEFHCGERRVLCPDGSFAAEPTQPARYHDLVAALRAAERAPNRLAGGTVMAAHQPYLPI